MSYLGTKDPHLELARGNIAGLAHINKFGRNPDIDTAAANTIGRDIWDGGIAGGADWAAPTTARTHQIVSTDADDDGDPAGDGAQTVKIFGLDASYALQEETVTLNGTDNVATENTYTMIYRMIVIAAGSIGYNAGTITATADSDGTVTAQIAPVNNQTLMAIYMVPAAKKAYMTSFYGSLAKAGGATKLVDLFLVSKAFGEVWRVRHSEDLTSDGVPSKQHVFAPYKPFAAKELIILKANPSADAQDVSGGFDLILVDD